MYAVRNWRLEAANHMGSCCYVSYLQTNVCYTPQTKMSVCVHAMSETTAPKLVAWGWSLTNTALSADSLVSYHCTFLHNVFV